MPAARTRVGDDELSRLLARLRDDAGLSGAAAAQRAGDGFSQSKISRWESGRMTPSLGDVERYARALGASSQVRRRLVALAHDRHDQHRATTPARVGVSRGAAHEQRVLRNESAARQIAVFHPLLIPGALQSEAYVRAVFSSGGLPVDVVEARTAARLRRADLLGDDQRRFTFLLTQGALGWRPAASPEVMAAQLEHLVHVSRRPNVRLGVIPWGAPATVFPPCGFDVYDARTVVVGVVGGAAYYNDPDDVARYLAMLDELEQLAVYDEAMHDLVLGLVAEYRRSAANGAGDEAGLAPGDRRP
jgi:transcriptional regulator with XRE-family HTH domain